MASLPMMPSSCPMTRSQKFQKSTWYELWVVLVLFKSTSSSVYVYLYFCSRTCTVLFPKRTKKVLYVERTCTSHVQCTFFVKTVPSEIIAPLGTRLNQKCIGFQISSKFENSNLKFHQSDHRWHHCP